MRCLALLFSACFLPRDPGPCKGKELRYHYNSNENVKDCVGFIYGGCRGNANRFQTLEECISQCRDKVSLRTTAKTKKDKEVKVSKRIPGCTGEHGCCDDYVTPAKGPNQEGCPGRVISCSFWPFSTKGKIVKRKRGLVDCGRKKP